MYVYIHIYIYIYTHIHIYIYIVLQYRRARQPELLDLGADEDLAVRAITKYNTSNIATAIGKYNTSSMLNIILVITK